MGVAGRRIVGNVRRLSNTGVLFAAGAWMFAWLPSLLPGGTVLQGISLGLLAAVGYGVGAGLAALARLVRRAGSQPTSAGPASLASAAAPAEAAEAQSTDLTADADAGGRAKPSRKSRLGPGEMVALVAVVFALVSGAWLVKGVNWQADQVGAQGLSVSWLMATVIGLATFALLLAVARGLRRLSGFLAAKYRTWTPAAVAGLAAGLTTAAVVVGIGAASYAALQIAFNRIDANTAGQSAPTATNRSGSPASLIPFASLGREGRSFVTQGSNPDTTRIFAGLESAPSAQARADLAVADLLRAGGESAPVWVGITTTGNGFIDPAAAQAAEDATGGAAALVAIQYSTLPSWLSFLTDQSSAQEAGVALYEALSEARDALPVEQRPQLILYGESLGAFGSAAPFRGMTPAQIAERVDGALWVGPPAATQPVSGWTASGVPPIWQPIVDAGRQVRYAASLPATTEPPGDGPWVSPRIMVLQNPTDPVVWFTPTLAWRPAEWLQEPRGPGVQEGTRWLPILMFLQVALDLPQAVGMPSGYGHDYTEALPEAWRQVLTQST